MTSSGTQAGYDRTVRGQVLGQIRLCLSRHELLRVCCAGLISVPRLHQLSGTPPPGKDGLLLGREGEGRGVAWDCSVVSTGVHGSLAHRRRRTHMKTGLAGSENASGPGALCHGGKTFPCSREARRTTVFSAVVSGRVDSGADLLAVVVLALRRSPRAIKSAHFLLNRLRSSKDVALVAACI